MLIASKWAVIVRRGTALHEARGTAHRCAIRQQGGIPLVACQSAHDWLCKRFRPCRSRLCAAGRLSVHEAGLHFTQIQGRHQLKSDTRSLAGTLMILPCGQQQTNIDSVAVGVGLPRHNKVRCGARAHATPGRGTPRVKSARATRTPIHMLWKDRCVSVPSLTCVRVFQLAGVLAGATMHVHRVAEHGVQPHAAAELNA